MIDNTAREILIKAADEAGWDEDTMLLMATRFIAHLADEDPIVTDKFKAYLNEQVAEEMSQHPAEQLAADDCPNCGETLSVEDQLCPGCGE